ncbi:MAG: hypothetical protein B0D91_10565 [Oceanospirillales bacterium LUC14_002_19_P2]|nr:MAG: hypothetical protein B0D91_10565 [Oceanospirillales bacterium LUC14_002_19_P2]
MDHKKVGQLAIEVPLSDGTSMVKQFDAEITDGTFAGDVSSLEGTFQGSLTADALDAAKNLTIAGRSVARSWAFYVASKGPAGFDDDFPFTDVVSHTFYIPEGEEGFVNIFNQYRIDDTKRDNDNFPTRFRLVLNGQVIYQMPSTVTFGYFYNYEKLLFHSASGYATPGYNTFQLQYKWEDISTNVYPVFYGVLTKIDFIKK